MTLLIMVNDTMETIVWNCPIMKCKYSPTTGLAIYISCIYIYMVYIYGIYMVYIYIYKTVPKFRSCHKAIMVITGRAYCYKARVPCGRLSTLAP